MKAHFKYTVSIVMNYELIGLRTTVFLKTKLDTSKLEGKTTNTLSK